MKISEKTLHRKFLQTDNDFDKNDDKNDLIMNIDKEVKEL